MGISSLIRRIVARIIHWPAFVVFAVIVAIVALGVRVISGLPLWACFLMSVVAVLVNGLVIAWEDGRPGGFNNTRDQPPHDPNGKL